MAIVEIHPEPIAGPWVSGFVLDKHVISSVPTGYMGDHLQFDTVRTALGELVYRLKNKGGPSNDIIDSATAFVQKHWAATIDCVISPPPSKISRVQPAEVIAAGIANALGLPVLKDVVVKVRTTPQMKNQPLNERRVLLAQALQAGPTRVAGRHVLIVDDLWQTGETMRRAADVVTAMGAATI